ncbi:PSME3-interacting protein isoform X1 [Planococcus citri]|uniref:PSME3-interacting protein isoform X1 n=1 Tax=Planococcus citri TaxID=170843 RepID=UPI0031F91B9F
MSSGFITEAEIEEQRRVRQEEWEKVRQPDQPIEAPEEEIDNRTLYERLEEQRQKKEFEYEETHRLKNMIKGLDDDEIEFLDMVDRTKMEEEKRLMKEEAKELQEYRNKVAALKEQSLAQKIDEEVTPVISSLNDTLTSGSKTQHHKLLANLAKKRASSDKLPSPPAKKSADEKSSSDATVPDDAESKTADSQGTDLSNSDVNLNANSFGNGVLRQIMTYPTAMKCVGVLPGIGSYISEDSSDSDQTSGSDIEDQQSYDLKGQKLQGKK